MQSSDDSDLTSFVHQLTSQIQDTLEKILSEPQSKEDEDSKSIETYTGDLKTTALALERRLKEIRLQALGDRKLATQESIKLLQRDIELKKRTIDKYATKLDQWSQELPILRAQSEKLVLHRTDGKDFDTVPVATTTPDTTK